MSYTRTSLTAALQSVLMHAGGTEALFSRHRWIRDGLDAETYAKRFERFSLEKKVGIVACLFGPHAAGNVGVVCNAYIDLCKHQALRFASA
ncbi:MAG: hypothetical protein DI537_10710 [Stutzerimonas stutzeri]|nr:MAG: hypothetical protein DI537_10710 [Stutzerimonas stutzeri]